MSVGQSYRVSNIITPRAEYSTAEVAILTHTEAYRRELLRLTAAMSHFNPVRSPWKAIALHRWLQEFFVPLIRMSEKIKSEIIIAHYDDLGYRIAGYEMKSSGFLDENFNSLLKVSQRLYDLAVQENQASMPVDETNQLVDQLQREVHSIYHDLTFHYDEDERCLVYVLVKEGVDLWHRALFTASTDSLRQKRKNNRYRRRTSTDDQSYRTEASHSSKSTKPPTFVKEQEKLHRQLRVACVLYAAGYRPDLTVSVNFGIPRLSGSSTITPGLDDISASDGKTKTNNLTLSTPTGSPKSSPKHGSSRNSPGSFRGSNPMKAPPPLDLPWINHPPLLKFLQDLLPWYTRHFSLSQYMQRYRFYHDLIMSLQDLEANSISFAVESSASVSSKKYNQEMRRIVLSSSSRDGRRISSVRTTTNYPFSTAKQSSWRCCQSTEAVISPIDDQINCKGNGSNSRGSPKHKLEGGITDASLTSGQNNSMPVSQYSPPNYASSPVTSLFAENLHSPARQTTLFVKSSPPMKMAPLSLDVHSMMMASQSKSQNSMSFTMTTSSKKSAPSPMSPAAQLVLQERLQANSSNSIHQNTRLQQIHPELEVMTCFED